MPRQATGHPRQRQRAAHDGVLTRSSTIASAVRSGRKRGSIPLVVSLSATPTCKTSPRSGSSGIKSGAALRTAALNWRLIASCRVARCRVRLRIGSWNAQYGLSDPFGSALMVRVANPGHRSITSAISRLFPIPVSPAIVIIPPRPTRAHVVTIETSISNSASRPWNGSSCLVFWGPDPDLFEYLVSKYRLFLSFDMERLESFGVEKCRGLVEHAGA